MADESGIEDWDEWQDPCACCPPEGPPGPPGIERLTCGFQLDPINFPPGVRDDIPGDAVSEMLWLTFVHWRKAGGTSNDVVACPPESEGGGNTYETHWSGSEYSYLETYDPKNDCKLSASAGGTGNFSETHDDHACDPPPGPDDEPYTPYKIIWSGVAGIENIGGFDEPVEHRTGTDGDDPYENSVLLVAPPYHLPGSIGTPWTEVLTVSATAVLCMRTLEWNYDGGFGHHYDGNASEEFGVDGPDDYRLEFDLQACYPDPDNALRRVEMMATLYFTPWEGEEEEVEEISLTHMPGDDPQELSWPYGSIGKFRLGEVLVRIGKTGKFYKFEIEPT